jgi:filamentous hemagglutinin family protein
MGQGSIWGSRERRLLSRLASYLKVTTAIVALLSNNAAWAQQLPTGGAVAAGSATIAQPNASTLNVNQSTNQAIINWNAFSVGQGGMVNFNQPSSSSATLNRVLGSTPSSIAGRINAPGTVLLVNPNGIAITKSGVINTGSFAASTLDIKDADFLAGNYKFTGNGGSAGVTNAGRINVSDGGFAALMGGQVANNGVISARLGKVGLGAGELITLDFAGDGFLSVAVPSSQLGKMVDQNGALVTNSGKIRADGGQVFLSAATANTILRDAVNVPGSIRANTVGTREGKIVLGGGAGGKVNVTGTLAASGGRKNAGGKVEVSGADVKLAGAVNVSGKTGGTVVAQADQNLSVTGQVAARGRDGKGGEISITSADVQITGAILDASGATGGGTILIGGDYQGSGTLAHALNVTVDANSVIRADATEAGDGGKVVVWSDGATRVAGSISAVGAAGGKGGLIETSGHILNIGGIRVKAGPGGRWLLDPVNLLVDAAAYAAINAALNSVTNVELMTDATTATGFGTVDPAGDGDIIFTNQGAVSWSTAAMLTLNAYRNIVFNSDMTISGGGALVMTTGTSGTGDYILNGHNIAFTGGAAAGASLSINGNLYTLLHSMAEVQNINNALGGFYALAVSLDAASTAGWAPLGTDGLGTVLNGGNGFAGTFAGLGHTISNLTVNIGSNWYAGLFGYTNAGTLRDIGMVGGSVSAGDNSRYIGGLVGYINGGSITNAYATGAVSTGNSAVQVGGLVGYTNSGSITNAYATGAVSAGNDAIQIGGLVGENSATHNISNAYATGAVSAGDNSVHVGGLVGVNVGTITNAYATGTVSAGAGSFNIGGLVGFNIINITSSYATGAVSAGAGSFSIGGLVGNNPGTVSASYWDTGTTGQSDGCFGNTTCGGGATGLATADAFTQANYGAFDFTNTWFMVDGQTRPFGRWEHATTIINTHQLQLMSMDLTASYRIGAAIDASETRGSNPSGMWTTAGFVPVGSSATPFTGGLTGNGMTVSNLIINRPAEDFVGLFGRLDGTVDGVGLIAPEITGNTIVGALAGANNGIVTNSYAITDGCGCGEVIGVGSVGGLIGQSAGIVSGSYATVNVAGTGNSVGGLIGFVGAGSVANSYATGTVYGDLINASNVGGLIGSTNPFVTVSGSYATGAVEGNTSVGGLIGFNLAAVTDSYATGNVRGTDRIGGLVGWAATFGGFGSLERVFATGLVGGDPTANSTSIGGLAGQNDGSITDAYATGAVAGDDFVGGLIGFNNAGATATNVYATGFVTFVNGSTANFGALAGTNQGNIANGVWNTQASGQPTAIGDDSGSSITSGVTTAGLRAALPAGFGSAVWGIVPGVSNPYLNFRFPTGPTVVSGTATGFAGGDAGLVVGIAIDGTVIAAYTATGADGSYQFMLDPMSSGNAAFTYLTRDRFLAGSSRPSNAVADLVASAPGFPQGHATGLDFAPDRVLTVAGSGIADLDGVIGLMERALYGPSLTSSVPDQLFNLGFTPSSIIRFDSSTAFVELVFAPFGTDYRLQSAAANFSLNQPLGCACDLNNLEVIASGNLAVDQMILAAGTVLMTAPGDITFGAAGLTWADGGGDAIVLAAGGDFINNAGSGALVLTDPGSRWLIYANNPGTTVKGGLDSGNPDILNVTYASYPPAGVTELGNRYLFAPEGNTPTTPTDGTTPNGNPPSQYVPPGNNPANPGVSIAFQNTTGGPINVSFTPSPRTASNNPGTDVSPASLPDGAALATNNGMTFLPISQYDANQYSQFALPGYADQAGLSAVFTMIARGVDQQRASDYLIDTFWNGTAGAWNAGDPGLSAKVTFSDGLGNTVVPNGHAGFPVVAGSTDFAAMLKSGPVMISGGGTPAHWLLATQMTTDGKGIVANDPVTGKQVLLTYDPVTKAVGGVTGVFDPASNKFVSFAEASTATPALVGLQSFVPATFLSVSAK